MATPFDISARPIDDVVELSPSFATASGAPGGDSKADEFSPEGWNERADLARNLIAAMAPHLEHPDRIRRFAAHVVTEHAVYTFVDFEAPDHLWALSRVASPFQAFREVFELIDHTDETSAHDAATRLETIADPLTGCREALQVGIESERVSLGETLDLEAFHSPLLGSGEMGFDLLAGGVSGDFGA